MLQPAPMYPVWLPKASITETVAIAQDIARKIAESCIEHGDPLPDAFKDHPHNLAFDIQIPVGMP